jgi:hypothetical protein
MLKILKSGIINGGEADWKYNEESKAIEFSGRLKVKIGPIKKTIDFADDYHIERERILSKNVAQGQIIDLEGGAKLEVLSVAAQIAYCQLDTPECHGVIQLDLSRELIDPLRVTIKVNYSGIKATVNAERI